MNQMTIKKVNLMSSLNNERDETDLSLFRTTSFHHHLFTIVIFLSELDIQEDQAKVWCQTRNFPLRMYFASDETHLIGSLVSLNSFPYKYVIPGYIINIHTLFYSNLRLKYIKRYLIISLVMTNSII